jgi:PAS domain S-box-containing protein
MINPYYIHPDIWLAENAPEYLLKYLKEKIMDSKNSAASDLFLLMINLSQMTSKGKIIDVFIEALKEIWTGMRVNFTALQPQSESNLIIISSAGSTYGYLHIENISAMGNENESLLYKACEMLSVILRKIEQDILLADDKLRLQNLVDERTKELSGSYEDLKLEVAIRKQAEEAIQKGKLKLELMIKNSPDMLMIQNTNGKVDYASPQSAEILGFSSEEIKNLDMMKQIHPDDLDDAINKQLLAFKGKNLINIEYRFIKKNGDIVWLNHTVRPVIIDGEISEIQSTVRDITDRKLSELEIVRAQKKAEESENYLNKIINNIGDPVFVKDDQSIFYLVNDAFCELLGLSKEEIIGKTLGENLPADEMEHFFKIDKLVLKNGQDNLCEESLTVKAGNTRTISTRKTRYIDNDGKKFLIGIIRDITEHKRTEKLLKESEKLFKDVTFSMADWVWEVDKDGRYTYVSEKVEEILGFRPDELIGKTPFDFMQEDEAKRVGELFNEIISLNNPIKDLVNWNLSRDGERVCLLTNAIPLFDSSDELVGYRGVDKDITERKLAEDALVQSTKRLIQAQQIAKMGDFTWDVTTGEVSWSDSLFYLLKYDKTEKIDFAKVDKDIHFPDDLLEISSWLNEGIASREEKLLPKEYRLICKDGEVIYVRAQGIIERKEGESVKLIATLFDITERRQAELDLIESEEYFRTLIENSSDVISILDDKGIITYESPSHVKVLGYETGKLIGENVFGLVHPDDRERISGQFVKLLKKPNGIEQVSFRFLHQNGTWIYIEGTGTNLLNSSKIKGIVVNYRDITDRKQAEEKLKYSEERLALVIKGSLDAPWDWDFANKKIYYSPQWWAQIGYKPDELTITDQLWYELTHPDDRESTDAVLDKAIKSDMESYQIEFRLKHKDCHYVPILSRGFITRDSGGNMIRVTGTNMDLTERNQAEELLKQRMSDLEIFNEAAVDREIAINDLRKETNELLLKLGKEEKYEIVE